MGDYPEPYGASLRPFKPSLRDRLAAMLMGESKSAERHNFVEGLMGSTGLGNTGPGPGGSGLVDYLPGGQIFPFEEAVQGGDAQGAALAIVPVPAAKALKMPVNLPVDDLFRQAVHNTPGASVSDDGLLMALQRFQKPEQHLEESARTGVFYLPEGSPNARYYKNATGPGSYGGTDKIAGETLYKNPLVVKGATGGKVPEEAYKTLAGKEGLKQLTADVFQHVPPSYVRNDPGIEQEILSNFIEKYAPDYANDDLVWNLLRNHRDGNRMRYALQELAIANKAREAGHDSIIGIGRSKAGPTFSEVFDLRESHYPDPFGEFQMLPDFEKLLKDYEP